MTWQFLFSEICAHQEINNLISDQTKLKFWEIPGNLTLNVTFSGIPIELVEPSVFWNVGFYGG